QQLQLGVVDDHDCRARHAVAQVVARHPRALLTGIEDERNVERAALLGVLHHRAGIVRRDDRETAVADGPKRELPGIGHGAGVERRDLIVVLIGAAEERRAELAVDFDDQRRIDARRLEPAPVLAEILAGRRHQQRTLAEQRERVRDVRRAAAAPLHHRVDEEAETDAVHVLRQEVLGEFPGERHQIVVRDPSGDDRVHFMYVPTLGASLASCRFVMPMTSMPHARYSFDSASVENCGPSMFTYVPPRCTVAPTADAESAATVARSPHTGWANATCATRPRPKNVLMRPLVRSKN